MANVILSFFYGWVTVPCILYQIFYILSSVKGHLGCFCVLGIVNSTAVDIGVLVSFQIRKLECPGMGLLGHMIVLFLVLQGTSIMFSLVVVPVYIPMSSIKRFPFSTFSPAYIVYRLFDDGHSDWCEVTLIFICISLIINTVEHLLYTSWPFVCLLWRNVYLDILPIFWLGCLLFYIERHELFLNFGV